MVEKGIKDRICHAIRWYVKAINKYMKDYDKNKESSYLKYWDANHLYGWAMSVGSFKWDENTSRFSTIKDSDVEYFLELDVQ